MKKRIIALLLLVVIISLSISQIVSGVGSFKIFLPVISKDVGYYGLAFSNYNSIGDLELLQASWYYNWSTTPSTGSIQAESTFVPMLWSGNPSSDIPQNYSGYLLAFNEPNVSVQNNYTVQQLKDKYLALKAYYPNAKLVIGGFSIWANNYYAAFLNLLNPADYPDYIHVHTYREQGTNYNFTNSFINTTLDNYYNLNPADIWITEFNNINSSSTEFQELMNILKSKPYIKAIAPFTNRQNGEWWNLPYAELITNNALNAKGTIYVNNR